MFLKRFTELMLEWLFFLLIELKAETIHLILVFLVYQLFFGSIYLQVLSVRIDCFFFINVFALTPYISYRLLAKFLI